MKTEKNLDFLIIGAGKSGTTTLFELAKEHPELSMPHDKEVPFFSDNAVYKNGLDWYYRTYFSNAPKDTKWGTVTPQYMKGKGPASVEVVAKRIYQEFPDIKLVAILRHPVKRAFSQYKMMYKRNHITAPFDKAVNDLLERSNLNQLRKNGFTETNTFLLGGEYGRILKKYYKLFEQDKIKIFFTKDLKSNPESILKEFFSFLDVDHDFRPKNIGKEFRKGGFEPRIKALNPGTIYKIPFVKKIWKNYVPYKLRKRVEYSINLWNTKPDNRTINPGDPIYQKLVDHYRPEIKTLEKLIGEKVPWQDFK